MFVKKTIAIGVAVSTIFLSGCDAIKDYSPDLAGVLGGGSSEGIDIDVNRSLETLDYIFINDTPRAPVFSREKQFGSAWTDDNTTEMGGNGCNTRDDVLGRDLDDTTFEDEDECVVSTGTLKKDPYTGREIRYRKGTTTSRLVQVDHIVSLENAWDSGAWQWSQQERVNYANDTSLLLAVDGPEAQEKAGRAADQWLVPHNSDFQCAYAALQVDIKDTYGLSMTSDERDVLKSVLERCN